MTDDDVKAMLERQASAVRTSPDALDRIHARVEDERRRPTRMPLLAAAVLVVVALVGVALLVDHDEPETRVASTPATTAPVASTTQTAPTATEPPGVWPTNGDHVDADTLADPVKTAARYVADTVGSTESTVLSAFRQSDPTSGEVEVSGDITATIVLAERDGRWFVQTVWSPLVESRELAPGQVDLIAKTDGVLTVKVLDADGNVVMSAPASGVTNGQEHLVVPDAPDGTPLTVRWLLQTPMDGNGTYAQTALGDVRLYGGAASSPSSPTTTMGTQAPNGAISDEAGLDAVETVRAYLHDRTGRDVTVDDLTTSDDTHGEVTWEAGVVKVQKSGSYWFVTEAIGDSIQIAGTSLDVGYIGGSLRLAQAGTVHLSVGDVTWDVRNDTDREGTTVHFEHAVPTDEPVILRAVFETDTGYVSVAEKVVG